MTRWALLAFLCFATPAAATAQEVVVFADGRSLVVSSHRQQGTLTVLKVDGGELAVASTRITEIRKEGAEAQQSARAAAAANLAPSPAPHSPPAEKPQPSRAAPSPPPPPPPPEEEEEPEEPEESPAPAEVLRPAPRQRSMPPGAAKRLGAGVQSPTNK